MAAPPLPSIAHLAIQRTTALPPAVTATSGAHLELVVVFENVDPCVRSISVVAAVV
jgi:hypothetical protein